MRCVHHPVPLWTFVAATCLTVTTACTTLRPVESDDLRGPNPPDRVQVTTTDDSTVVLHNPTMVDDTLVGFVDGTRRAFPLSQATEIDAWEADRGRTAAAIVFGGGLGALTYLVIESYKAPSPLVVCVDNMVMCGPECRACTF